MTANSARHLRQIKVNLVKVFLHVSRASCYHVIPILNFLEKESNYSNSSNMFSFSSSNQPKSQVSTASSGISASTLPSGSINNSSSTSTTSNKQPCTIYKINLDFLKNTNAKSSEKFVFNQLCENSTRTIQREISNFSSQFIFTEADEATKHNSIYRRIIASNVSSRQLAKPDFF